MSATTVPGGLAVAAATESAAPSSTHPKYRADVDGLRAIAVLAVVGFHAFPNWVPGGFIGVDIFFVISGFLISTIIFSNLERGSFSFVEFYSRRIKRIFPALLLVLVACFTFAWFALLPDEYKQLGKHIAGGAGFLSNFVLWRESGYFDNAADTKPLLHLWSLAIEEQFYIFWPLLLAWVWKQKRSFIGITATVAVLSFAFNIYAAQATPVAAFYSPAPRFWELMIGGILAYTTLHQPQWHRHRPNAQASIGLAALGLGLLLIDRERAFPGWWALLPTLGAFLLISAGRHAWINRHLLSSRVLVWFGLISFPLYLWHWPLLAYARIVSSDSAASLATVTPAPTVMAMVALAIGLSWLTYGLVEKPIRLGAHGEAKSLALLALMLGIGGTGYYGYRQGGFPERAKNIENITQAIGEWQYPADLKSFTFRDTAFYFERSQGPQTTLFIGDSNIEHYYPRIDELISKHPASTNSAIFSTGGNCPPIPNTNNRACAKRVQDSLELALARPDISTVVLGGQWFGFLLNKRFNYFEDSRSWPIDRASAGYYKSLAALENYIKRLKQANKRVFLILNIPIGKELDPKYMIQRTLADYPQAFTLRHGGIELSALNAKYGFIKADLTRIARNNQIELIDPIQYLCQNDTCPSVDRNNEPIYKDQSHLRPYFVRHQLEFIDATMAAPGKTLPRGFLTQASYPRP